MSEHGTLSAELRHTHGKGAARTLRRAGKIPAVMYGAGQETISLQVAPDAFRKAVDPERDWNTLFSLTIHEDGKPVTEHSVMVADVQRDSISRAVKHIDFLRIDPEQEVVRKIPVEYIGRSAGVVKGGKLKKFRRTVKIACKPADIPVKLVVDITPVDGGQSIRMKDVTLENARIVEHPEQRLVFVEMPKAKPEEAEAPAAAKGKKK